MHPGLNIFHLFPCCPTSYWSLHFTLLASLPGNTQGKEKVKLKSMNFTSAKVHNVHPLPLASKYQVLQAAFSFCPLFWQQPLCHSNLHHPLIGVLLFPAWRASQDLCPSSLPCTFTLCCTSSGQLWCHLNHVPLCLDFISGWSPHISFCPLRSISI